ncbi:MAG: protease inhibitor I42 family protein [Gammaproteobacteria bacterium]|nr:protease inhibitor I42 family protein [Gammaproteobacteria bacterium]
MQLFRLIALVLFIVGSLVLVPAFASPVKKKAQTKKLTNSVVLKRGQQEFKITLASNATTGYSWYLLGYDHKLVDPESAKYLPPKSELVGAPGKMVWTFQVDEDAFDVPRITRVILVYARPWDLKHARIVKVPVVIP